MALLTNLKKQLYLRKFNQSNQQNTTHQPIPFQTVNHVGILFDATKETNRDLVLNYQSELRKNKRKVSLLGYYNANEVPASFTFPCFCNKDLGWDLTPNSKATAALDFMKEPFELLMALHTNPSNPLEYISTASKARFRVGYYRKEMTTPYDLMIHSQSKGLRALIQQMETYLKKIN